MLTLALVAALVLFLIIRAIVLKANKDAKLGKEVDKFHIGPDEISPEVYDLSNKIKNTRNHKYVYDDNVKVTKLPDGQILGPFDMGLETFKNMSDLNIKPTQFEWRYLKEILRKLHN